MKKLPLILNIVLAIAVIVLYVLYFTSPNKEFKHSSAIDTTKTDVSKGIVYINIDSVYSNYQMYKDVVGDLENKYNVSDAQLKAKQTAFEKNVNDYKYKLERGLITRTEAAQIEQGLAQQQQQLMGLQQQLEGQLAEEQQVAQRKVLNSIMEYLAGLEGEKSYQFVLGTSFGGNVLYANDNFDITKSVTEGLNESYKKLAEENKKDK